MRTVIARESDGDLGPDRFAIRRAQLRGAELAFVHEGVGGLPLLLIHGWPETKRIWWRNIASLADAGFEVLAPDLRGFGESGPADDGFYDVAASSNDLHQLVSEVLGHSTCIAAGGDYGGVVLQDLMNRHPGLVERAVLFNTIPPFLFSQYSDAGVEAFDFTRLDHFVRHGQHASDLMRELDSPGRRLEYVAEFYGDAGWASRLAFDATARAFMAEPFADQDTFRSSIKLYEYAFGVEPSAPPLLFEPNPTPTLVLYGPEDAVVPPSFVDCMAVAFVNAVGPFAVPGSGHFLQWEQAAVFNRAVQWLCHDRLAART
jgi:pimeloyl-ACP methyl ester carboxylesterase